MTTKFHPGRDALRVALAAGAVLFLAACVSETGPTSETTGTIGDGNAPQPRSATYACETGGSIRVDAGRGAVRLTNTEGEVFELMAAPPNQNTRFGQSGMALVVEGGEALWMHAGKEPLTCRR